jgi:hypothetical protein
MGDEEVTTQDWVVGCSMRVLTKHTKEVREQLLLSALLQQHRTALHTDPQHLIDAERYTRAAAGLKQEPAPPHLPTARRCRCCCLLSSPLCRRLAALCLAMTPAQTLSCSRSQAHTGVSSTCGSTKLPSCRCVGGGQAA